jgi:MGT family glycosyltransferase
MATILWFNIPAAGHINPTLGVVDELRQRGHDVTCFSNEESRASIERTGARFVAYPDGIIPVEEGSDLAKRPAHLEPLLLRCCQQLVPFAEDEIRREAPDLVLYDAYAPWGGIAARRTDVPAVTSYPMLVLAGAKLGLGFVNTLKVLLDLVTARPATKRERNRLQETYGDAVRLPLLPSIGDKNIVFQSPEFQFASSVADKERWITVGPTLDERTRDEAVWTAPPGDGPLVFISPGTINTRSSGFFREVFKAFRDHPGRFVMFTGRSTDLRALEPFPSNFVVSSSMLPQLQILEQADAFITHGGMGSLQEALHHGVPMILIPHHLEQLVNARRVAELGAGLVLGDQPPYGRVKAAALRRALGQVLADEGFRRRARELGDAGRAAGGARLAADELERLLPARD